jgi:hypothetical protein
MSVGTMMHICRALVLLVSFYGYLQYVSKKIKLEFSLAVIFSGIGSVMFLAGILNVLRECAVLILLGGILLAIDSLRKRESIKNVVSPGTLFFGVMAVYLLVLLYGDEFVHYDNFSHWAIAIKVMLQNNRFPNFQDNNIGFQSYPLGSSVFVYYMVKIVGTAAEWTQMYAQALLLVSMLTCLFAFSNSVPGIVLTAGTSLMLLCGNTSLYDMLVDTLLPLVALAAMAVCIYYKADILKKGWALLLFNVFLISIKNSGTLFVLFTLGYALLQTRSIRARWKVWLVQLVVPFGVLYLWQRHVRLVYVSGMAAKHSLSVYNFRTRLKEKTADELNEILQMFFGKVFSGENRIVYLLIFSVVLLLLAKWAFNKYEKPDKGLLGYAMLAYILYDIGLLGTYIFSMPEGEASYLAGYSRYHNTILIFITGIVWIVVTSWLEQWKKEQRQLWQAAAIGLACMGIVYCTGKPNLTYLQKQVFESTSNTYRFQYDALIQEYSIPTGKSYMIVAMDDQTGYLYYMTRYLLLPQQTSSITSEEAFDTLKNQWENYDYLIVFNASEEIQQWIDQTFGAGKQVISLSQYK